MNIKLESTDDIEAIEKINLEAFNGHDEGMIVSRLRSSGDLVLSLVASIDGKLVGHIAFSKMTLNNSSDNNSFVGLGPMAVTKDCQRSGIGSALVREGIKLLSDRGIKGVFVLGHPEYYPKFGFKPSQSTFGISSKYEVPDNVFMALEIEHGVFNNLNGVINYSSAFD